jgi:hypothetical protein
LRKNNDNGKVQMQEVSPEVQREACKHEVKRLERERDSRSTELEKSKDDYRVCVVLYCAGRKSKKEVHELRARITKAQNHLNEAEGHLTLAKVKLERTMPRSVTCGECLQKFTVELFQRHLDVAKARGVHCLYYRQGL